MTFRTLRLISRVVGIRHRTVVVAVLLAMMHFTATAPAEIISQLNFEIDDAVEQPFFDVAPGDYEETDKFGNSWRGYDVSIRKSSFNGVPNSCVLGSANPSTATLEFTPASPAGIGRVIWAQKPNSNESNFKVQLQYRLDGGEWTNTGPGHFFGGAMYGWGGAAVEVNQPGDVELRWVYTDYVGGAVHLDGIMVTDINGWPDSSPDEILMHFVCKEASPGIYPEGAFLLSETPEGARWEARRLSVYLPNYLGHNAHWLRYSRSYIDAEPLVPGRGVSRVSFSLASASSLEGEGVHRVQYSQDGGPWTTVLEVPVDKAVHPNGFQPYSVDINRPGHVKVRFAYDALSESYPGNAIDEIRIESFAAGPRPFEASAKIVSYGDSATMHWAEDGTWLHTYTDELTLRLPEMGLNSEMINSGVIANTAPEAVGLLDAQVRSYNPDICILQLGVADSWVDWITPDYPSRVPVEVYKESIRQMVQTLQADGVYVILMTSNQIGPRFEEWRNDRISLYAQAMRELASEEGTGLVDTWDLYGEYKAVPGNNISDLLIDDDAHPNEAGHVLEATHLAPVIISHVMTPASAPIPADGAAGTAFDALDVSWEAGVLSREHEVWLGDNPTTLSLMGTVPRGTETLRLEGLSPDSGYYWRVDERNGEARKSGAVWSFTTRENNSRVPDFLRLEP